MARLPYDWDAPDEPSFREEAECEEAYDDYLAEHDAAEGAPMTYEDWCPQYHEDRRNECR